MLSDQFFPHKQFVPVPVSTQSTRRVQVTPCVMIDEITIQAKSEITFGVLPYKVSTISLHQKYIDWRFAKILMGQNFYGPEEYEADIPYVFLTAEDLRTIAHVPWTKEILESPCPFFEGKMVKETHILTMNEIHHRKDTSYWFEWNLVVKNPPNIKPAELPDHYGIRNAVGRGEDVRRKIIARYPQK